MIMNRAVDNNITEKWVSAVIVAAGTSSRMRGIDKQLLEIGNKPVIARAVSAFQSSSVINEIVIVTREDLIDKIQQIVNECSFTKVKAVVAGGSTRQKSVFNGISATSEFADFIAIHDGARPFVNGKIITDVCYAAFRFGAAAAAFTSVDTIKVVNSSNDIIETIDRKFVRQMQTPQVFNKCEYLNARNIVTDSENFTDDCMLMEKAGVMVKAVECSSHNIKITTREDIDFAEAILRSENDDQNWPWL